MELMAFDIHGLGELKKYIEELEVEGEAAFRDEIKRTLMGIRNDYRSRLLPHKDTGKLYNSIKADTANNWRSGEVGSTEKHAVYLEGGTQAHAITPQAKKWLYFFWDKIGQWVFAKQVMHPGTPPRPYLTQSYLEWMAGLDGRLRQRLDKIK